MEVFGSSEMDRNTLLKYAIPSREENGEGSKYSKPKFLATLRIVFLWNTEKYPFSSLY
jgi:hypothetical protein